MRRLPNEYNGEQQPARRAHVTIDRGVGDQGRDCTRDAADDHREGGARFEPERINEDIDAQGGQGNQRRHLTHGGPQHPNPQKGQGQPKEKRRAGTNLAGGQGPKLGALHQGILLALEVAVE